MTQSNELPDQRVPPAMTSVGRSLRSSATRAHLVEAVYKRVGLSRAESARLMELVFQEITDCLERGEPVKLSAFGSFVVRSKRRRMGRNPRTGIEVPIPPRRVVVFKASDVLRKRLAPGKGATT
jgi:integration host factor subunit alpha